ncbi:hypothetical protein Tco_1360453 [Tanacetum coccineum]
MKIPIIRKGEYDIWSMRMQQYICHTDHNLWDVIVNEYLEEEPAPTGETSAPLALKTAIVILLLEGIMKAIAKITLEASQIKVWRNKPDIDEIEIDIDDLYNNLRVYEDEIKRSSSSNYASQNLAFLSFENTSSTNEVSKLLVEILGLVLLVELVKFHLPHVLMMQHALSLHNQQPVLNLKIKIFSRLMKMT